MREGQTAELTCSATGDPTPGLELSGKSRFTGIRFTPGRLTRIIHNVSPDDVGHYTCIAFNYAGITAMLQRLEVYPRDCPPWPPLPGPRGYSPRPVPPGCPPFTIDDSALAYIPPGSEREDFIRLPEPPPTLSPSVKTPSITFNHPFVHW